MTFYYAKKVVPGGTKLSEEVMLDKVKCIGIMYAISSDVHWMIQRLRVRVEHIVVELWPDAPTGQSQKWNSQTSG